MFLSLFSSGTFPVLTLVSSSLFGLKLFSAGLLSSELRELSKIKIRCTIYFENIPQIIIQIIYLQTGPDDQSITILAMVASVLSVASTLIIYFGEKDIENEYDVAKYFLRLFTTNSATGLSDEAKKAMENNKKKKKKLIAEMTKIVGSGGDKQIEIGSVTLLDDGLAVHVQHLVTREKMESFKREQNKFNITVDDYMESLYDRKIGKVFEAMWTHFELSDQPKEAKKEWAVRYQLKLSDEDTGSRMSHSMLSYGRDGIKSLSGGSTATNHPNQRMVSDDSIEMSERARNVANINAVVDPMDAGAGDGMNSSMGHHKGDGIKSHLGGVYPPRSQIVADTYIEMSEKTRNDVNNNVEAAMDDSDVNVLKETIVRSQEMTARLTALLDRHTK